MDLSGPVETLPIYIFLNNEESYAYLSMARSMKRCDSLPHSVTTHLRHDGIFSDSITTNFLPILVVK